MVSTNVVLTMVLASIAAQVVAIDLILLDVIDETNHADTSPVNGFCSGVNDFRCDGSCVDGGKCCDGTEDCATD